MSSDSDIEQFDDIDEQFKFATESIKDHLYVYHKGKPDKNHSPFSKVETNIEVPDDLWKSGNLIYDLYKPENCLGAPSSSSDSILRFDSHFESGNLWRAFHLGDNTYHCVLEYDRSGSCQWFYFRLNNVKNTRRYRFYISGFHKSKSLYTQGSKIFWYSEKRAINDGISWTRGGERYFYTTVKNQNREKKRSTLTFEMEFPYSDDDIYFCYSLPYTYSDLNRDILMWEKLLSPEWCKVEILCKSSGERDVPYLTITNPESEIPIEKRPYIFVTARIHPGESNSSYLLKGFMKFLTDKSEKSIHLLNTHVFKIIPMLNIDGVIEGFYRVCLSSEDLNRKWSQPDRTIHPDIFYTKNMFNELRKEKPVSIYIDFHGHSRLHGTFAYGCPNEGTYFEHIEKIYPRILTQLNDAFSWSHCIFSYPKDRTSAGRIVVRLEMDVLHCFTIETTFGGVLSGKKAGYLYDFYLWESLGSSCAEAIYHFINEEDILYIRSRDEIMSYYPKRNNIERDRKEEMFPNILESELLENQTTLTKDDNYIFSHKNVTNYFKFEADDVKTCFPENVKTIFNKFPKLP